jgi:hypothetical protein
VAARPLLPWLLLAGLLSLGGCASTNTVRGEVRYPAEMPVRAYPHIWVASGPLEHERTVRRAIAEHLRHSSRAKVRTVRADDLEPMRRQRRIPRATAVVLLDLKYEEKTRPEWTSHPETVCGPLGCYTSNHTHMYDVPVLEGRLKVTVYDGPTARVLQQKTLQARDEGRRYAAMRRRLARVFADRLRRLVDSRRERVAVELLQVEIPAVQQAIDAIERGQWRQGRRLLEQAVRSPAVRALPDKKRARVYYNLSQARRFDSSTMDDPQRHFRAAEKPLRTALKLHPAPRYAEAIKGLKEHRQHLETLRRQQKAARHNYRLEREASKVPPPPPGYEDSPPPAGGSGR